MWAVINVISMNEVRVDPVFVHYIHDDTVKSTTLIIMTIENLKSGFIGFFSLVAATGFDACACYCYYYYCWR